MNNLALVALLLLTACAQAQPLSYTQVRALLATPYAEVAEPISQLEEEVRQFRQTLVMSYMMGVTDAESAQAAFDELKVVDYYITSSWVAMVEGRHAEAQARYELGRKTMDLIPALLKPGGEQV